MLKLLNDYKTFTKYWVKSRSGHKRSRNYAVYKSYNACFLVQNLPVELDCNVDLVVRRQSLYLKGCSRMMPIERGWTGEAMVPYDKNNSTVT